MPVRDYVVGALFYVPTVGASLGAAHLLVRRRFRYLPLLVRTLAFMVCATAALVFVHVLPAALGVLSRPTVLIAAVALLAGCSRIPAAAPATTASEPAPPIPRSGPVSVTIAVLAVGVVVVYELARLRTLATQPITFIDMLSFHLPGVARFIQTGTLWRVDQFAPGFATAQYPNDGDFLLLSTVLPWRDFAFVRFMPLPFFAFTGIGAYALALELRATRAAAATMAAALITVPALSLLALEGLPDTVALATFASGLVFLIRHARSGRRDELLLAGLGLGISFGTKWYGTTSVILVVIVWAGAGLIARQAPGRIARDGAALLSMVVLGGGIWLVRNVIESGNPVYPKAVSPFGLHLFAGSKGDIVDLYGYSIAHYLFKPHILRTYIYPGFKIEFGIAGLVFAAGLLLAAVAAGRALSHRLSSASAATRATPAVLLALVLLTLGICAEFAVTPGSAYGPKDLPIWGYVNIRWLMPAAVVGAALAARGVLTLGKAGPLLELAGLAAALDGIHLQPSVPASTAVLVAVGVLALAAAVMLSRRRAGRGRVALKPRTLGATGLAAGVVAVAVLGRLDQRSYDAHTYASFDPTFAWIDAHAPAGHRVGVTGVWDTNGLAPVLPAFGPRLGNRVAYVGDRVRHSLHAPRRARTFEAELRHDRYDLLLIGLQDASGTVGWARSEGFRLVAASSRLALYAASGKR